MIIPVKCFTCGKVLADKYVSYLNEVKKMKQASGMDENEVIYLTENNVKKTPEGVVMDMLQLDRICCRRHMLTHVDIE